MVKRKRSINSLDEKAIKKTHETEFEYSNDSSLKLKNTFEDEIESLDSFLIQILNQEYDEISSQENDCAESREMISIFEEDEKLEFEKRKLSLETINKIQNFQVNSQKENNKIMNHFNSTRESNDLVESNNSNDSNKYLDNLKQKESNFKFNNDKEYSHSENDSISSPFLGRKSVYHVKYHPIHSFLFKHQRQGVGFLNDNLSRGKGCLLCDHMGLGKTITCLAYIAQFCITQTNNPIPQNSPGRIKKLNNSKSVLILMPTSVIGHWESEIEKVNQWLNSKNLSQISFQVMSSTTTKGNERGEIIEKWFNEKSVLLLSYGLFRSIILAKSSDSNYAMLLNTNYIFLDEGHRIKNTDSQTYIALREINTRKRIVCTGYPMQNNLGEYWSLINFARPGSLGTFDEFKEKYIIPIERGLIQNISDEKKKNARYLAYILHEKIRPFILRRDVSILQKTLPPKTEIFITVHPTLTQRNLLNALQREFQNRGIGRCYFWLFCIIGMCMNHPDILVNYLSVRERKLAELKELLNKNELDKITNLTQNIEDSSKKNRSSQNHNSKNNINESNFITRSFNLLNNPSNLNVNRRSSSKSLYSPCDEDLIAPHSSTNAVHLLRDDEDVHSDFEENENDIKYLYTLEKEKVDTLRTILKDYHTGDLFISNKMVILFRLIFQCKVIEEKIVVFSKSISTLNFIVDCISEHNNRDPFNSIRYVRLDGSTPAHRRKHIVDEFNNSNIDVALISTLAGGEGINLCSANRIVILDVNFNPSHDAEACCRVFRYGQKRNVYIYRLIGNATLEQKVIQSQLKKERLSNWIVDDFNSDLFLTNYRFQEEISPEYKENDAEIPNDFDVTNDILLQNIIESYRNKISMIQCHDTLLFNNDYLDLDESEKEDARRRMLSKEHTME